MLLSAQGATLREALETGAAGAVTPTARKALGTLWRNASLCEA